MRNGLFGWLMKLLPREFREEFGEEMEMVHSQQEKRATNRSWRSLADMLRLALAEHCNGLAMDFKLAARRLASRPFFTLAAVLSLALGTGASIAVFSLLEAAFWRPLPGVQQMNRLVNVKAKSTAKETFELLSYPNFADLRRDSRSLQDLAGFHGLFLSLRLEGEPEIVPAQFVTGNYFSLLGSRPLRGRLIMAQDQEDQTPVAVLSHHLWQTRLGGSQDVLGRRILLNGQPFTVVGIAPPGFRGTFVGFNFDVFLPASHSAIAGLPPLNQRGRGWVETIGRLQDDVSLAQAQQELQSLAEGLSERFPVLNEGLAIELSAVTGHDDDLRGGLALFLSLLLGVGLMVLAVACANLSNVYLARLLQRRPELALRLALGARRTRLLRLQCSEALLLGLSAAGLGALAAQLALAQVPSALSTIDPSLSLDARLGFPTLAFGSGLALLASLALGVLPTLRADRFRLAETLRDADQRSAAGSRLHRLSVGLQVALSLVVLISAGLFFRTLQKASAIDPGFATQGVIEAGLNPALAGLEDDRAVPLLTRIRQEVGRQPGFRSAALTNRVPLGLGARIFANPARIIIEGHPPPAEREDWPIEHSVVSEDYFATLDIPIVQGRAFRESDDLGSQPVAVVSRALSQRFWPQGDALGRSLRLVRGEDSQRLTIIGVAADAKVRSLDAAPAPYLYLPFSQHPRARMTLLAASTSADAGQSLKDIIHSLAPNLPLREVVPLSRQLNRALLPQRIAGSVAGALGLLGLFLVAVGLYGAAAQSVTARRRELAIRASLGARPHDIFALIVRQSLWAVLVGLALGSAAAAALSHTLRGFWTGLSPTDPLTFLTVPILLLAAALASTLLPTLQAVRTSPHPNQA
ncbi:MAG TPA: ADOP family duplicated permease [Acidobacteriota bacterium]|nr:ADOP family duplicated permease [Acidobacteriota bacterium]